MKQGIAGLTAALRRARARVRRIRQMQPSGCLVLALLAGGLLFSPASAFAKRPRPPHPLPPVSLALWANLKKESEDYMVHVTESAWAVEACEATWEKIDEIRADRGLPRYAGIRIRYTVLLTWNCPGSGKPTCPFWKNTIYGGQDGRPPDEALLHHGEEGCRIHTCGDGEVKEFCWDQGDPVDMLHATTSVYACGPLAGRPEGTHQFVNPKSTWAKDAVSRRTRILMEEYGITAQRIDEAGRGTLEAAGSIDFTSGKVEEFSHFRTAEQNRRDFLESQANLLLLQRAITAIGPTGEELRWHFTCPSIHNFWEPEAMILNAAGGCVSSEGFPHGSGLMPNWEGLTVKEAREKHREALMNTEPDNAVPNNLIIGIRYESNERNIMGTAMSVMLARKYRQPDLVWLMYCDGMYGDAGMAWQTALGSSGDTGACNFDRFRHPAKGWLPPWLPQ